MKLPLTLITLVSFTLTCSILAMNADEQALINTAQLNPEAQIKLLLDKGTSVNCADVNGSTPLHHACGSASISIVNLLIAHKADVNCQDISKVTPLHIAARHGINEMVETLLNNGAHVNAETKVKKTPLVWAAMGNQLDTVKLLLKRGADATWQAENGKRFCDYASDTATGFLMQELYKQYAFPGYGSDYIDELLK